METKSRTIQVQHLTVKLNSTFEQFTTAVESLLGRINIDNLTSIINDHEGAKKHIESLGGFEQLMIFGITDHGSLFKLIGKQRSAKQYTVGNPLIAFTMTQQDIRVALYAPLRILVYANEQNEAFVEYDLPSDLLGQSGEEGIVSKATVLNEKLAKLIAKADE